MNTLNKNAQSNISLYNGSRGIFTINTKAYHIEKNNMISNKFKEDIENVEPYLILSQGGQWNIKPLLMYDVLTPDVDDISNYHLDNYYTKTSFGLNIYPEENIPNLKLYTKFKVTQDLEFNAVGLVFGGDWYAATKLEKPIKLLINEVFSLSYTFYFQGGIGNYPQLVNRNSLYNYWSINSSNNSILQYFPGVYIFKLPVRRETDSYPYLSPASYLCDYRVEPYQKTIELKKFKQYPETQIDYLNGMCANSYTIGLSAADVYGSLYGSWNRITAIDWGNLNINQYHKIVHRIHGHIENSNNLYWESGLEPRGTGKITVKDNGFSISNWYTKIPHYYMVEIMAGNKFKFSKYLTCGFSGLDNLHKPMFNRIPYVLAESNNFLNFNELPNSYGLYVDNFRVDRIHNFWFVYYENKGATFIDISTGDSFYFNSDICNLNKELNILDIAHLENSPTLYVACSNLGLFKINVLDKTIKRIVKMPCKSVCITDNNEIYVLTNDLKIFELDGAGEILRDSILRLLDPQYFSRIRVNPNNKYQLFLERQTWGELEDIQLINRYPYWINVQTESFMQIENLQARHRSRSGKYCSRDLVWLKQNNLVVQGNNNTNGMRYFNWWDNNLYYLSGNTNVNSPIRETNTGEVCYIGGSYDVNTLQYNDGINSATENIDYYGYSLSLSSTNNFSAFDIISGDFVLAKNFIGNQVPTNNLKPVGEEYSWNGDEWEIVPRNSNNSPQGRNIVQNTEIDLDNNLTISFNGNFVAGDWYSFFVYDGFVKDSFSNLNVSYYLSRKGFH